MEADKSLTSGSDSTSKSTAAMKEKKKKLKAIFQKRHLNNLSFRNTTLNSTLFKASLKINNRALAHALEHKKSEVRAAEATILRLKEENQCLTTQVNREKMANEKVKEDIYARLSAVSGTLQLAVQQLVEAMDFCTSCEFHRLADVLAQAGTYGLLAASEINQVPSLPQSSTIKCSAVPPARILASPSKGTDDDLSCHDDGLDVDSDDNGQDVAGGLDVITNGRPPSGAGPISNLSMIVEQSYIVPSDTERFTLKPDPQEQRYQVMLRSSSTGSKVPEESPGNQHVVSRKSRSRPRHPAGLEPNSDIGDRADTVVRRSGSRDRRNVMIFQPSSSSANSPRCDEVYPDREEGVTVRRSRSRSTNRKSRSASGKTSESHCGNSDGGDSVPQRNRASTEATANAASDLVEQLCIYKGLVENGEITGDQFDSLQFVDETVLSAGSELPEKTAVSNPAAADSSHSSSNASDLVSSVDRNISSAKDTGASSELADADTERMVVRGQFVTRDKIARTPVKAQDLTRGKGSLGVVVSFRASVGIAELSDTSNVESNEPRTTRRLSKRDIATFLPIENSPNLSSSPAGTKTAVQGEKPQTQRRDSLKKTAKTSSNFAGLLPGEVSRRSRSGKAGCHRSGVSESVAKADAAGRKAADNVRLSRRGTFSVPGKGAPAAEDDITKENDLVLIDSSLEDISTGEGDFLPAKDRRLSTAQPDSEETGAYRVGDEVFLEEASNKNARDSRSELGQRISKRQRVHSTAEKEKSGNGSKAGDVCHEGVEHLSNTAKRSRIGVARSKLPESKVKESKVKDSRAKDGTMLDNPDKNLVQDLGHDGELRPTSFEPQNETSDVETKRRFAAYVSKPGNIVFNADRRDLGGGAGEVAKKSRSKSRSKPRSLLPLRQKARSKTSASAQPEEGTASVWDFQGTPRQAAVKENTERLLSVYDISLNDSSVIPIRKEEPGNQCNPKNKPREERELSKDDSFIVDRRAGASRHRRHESTGGIDVKESGDRRDRPLDSPHGILLALGNKRKPSARSKTVRYNIDETDGRKEEICQSDGGLTLDSGDVGSIFKVPQAKCSGNAKQSVEKNRRKEPLPREIGKNLASDKDLEPAVLPGQAALSAKSCQSKSNQAGDFEGRRASLMANDLESTGVSTETGINSKEASAPNLGDEKPKKRSSQICQSDALQYLCPDQELRSRRTASIAVSYREPPINKKLRRGDPFTSTIYDGSNHEPPKHFGYENATAAKTHRRALSSVENVLAGVE